MAGRGDPARGLAWRDGDTLVQLLSPSLSALEEDEIGQLPRPRAQADKGEWRAIVRDLFARNLVAEVAESEICRVRGRPVLCGAFGVAKKGRFTASGKPVLRLIVNLAPANLCQQAITGDVDAMDGATHWLTFVLDEGEVLTFSGDDNVCIFYLFELPEIWCPYFVVAEPVPRWPLGGAGGDSARASFKVPPNGAIVGGGRNAARPPERLAPPPPRGGRPAAVEGGPGT